MWTIKVRSWARRSRRLASRLLLAPQDVFDDARPVFSHLFAKALLVIVSLIYLICLTYWSLRNHWGFITYGFDIGIFDQGVWLLSSFEDPFVTVRGLNLFGDHTSFILLFLVPLYWLFNSAAALLVAQAAAAALGAVPVFLIARDRLKDEFVAVVLAAVYLLYPALGWTNLENFHPDMFEVPLVLFAFHFMFRERWRWFLVTLVLVLMVKEDVPLLTIALGIYVWKFHHRRIGLMTVGLSIVWGVVGLLIVIPAFNDAGPLYESRLAFGDVGGTVKAIFTDPLSVARLIGADNRPWYLFQLFAPLLFLPILGWRIAIVAIGPLAANLLAGYAYQYKIEYHYSTLIFPVLIVAAIYGVSRVWALHARMLICGATFIAVVVSVYAWGPAPFSRHPAPVGDPMGPFAADAREALAVIPPDASVSALPALVPHLTHRTEIYEYPNPWAATNWGDTSQEGERLPFADSVDFIVVGAHAREDADEILGPMWDDFDIVMSNDSLMVMERDR